MSSLQEQAAGSPEVVRAVVGVLGAVVLLAGARLARPALFMGSFAIGALGAVMGLQAAAILAPDLGTPLVLLVGACIGGVAVIVVAALAVRVALVVAGSLTGLFAVGAVAVALDPVTLPWWSVLAGALGGALLVPLLARSVLRLAAAAVGAVLVAWAVGHPTHPWLLGGLFALGALVQFGLVGGAPRDAEEAD